MTLVAFAFLNTLLLLVLLLWYWRRCTYWQRHGVCGPRGWPLFGSMGEFFCGRRHYGTIYEQVYKNYRLPFVGIYHLWHEPVLLLRSPTLVKEVLMRQFQNFENNALWINPSRDPIVVHNPFVATDDTWRQRRTELAAMFTPTKVKLACRHIQATCYKLTAYARLLDGRAFEAKQLCSQYTLAVVAAAGYGLDARTLDTDGAEDSEFMRLVAPMFAQHLWSLLETTALLFSPLIGRLIRYRYMPYNVQQWLRRIVDAVLFQRLSGDGKSLLKGAAVKRHDVIQWLIEQRQPIDRALIVGHCGTLLLEGFETSATLMAFALYELARHPHIQTAVQCEIDQAIQQQQQQQQHLQENGNTVVSYELLQQLHCMEAVLYETLRLYPAMQALFKRCTRDSTLPAQDESGVDRPLKITAGTTVIIPVQAIHYDETLWPEPWRFNPERFYSSDNDKQQRQQLSCRFLGFGEGPRMCPGMRFGLAQSKAGLLTLLRQYNVHVAPNDSNGVKEQLPKIASSTFLTATKNGIWLRLSSRH